MCVKSIISLSIIYQLLANFILPIPDCVLLLINTFGSWRGGSERLRELTVLPENLSSIPSTANSWKLITVCNSIWVQGIQHSQTGKTRMQIK